MKNLTTSIILSILMMFSVVAYSQNPTYSYVLKNTSMVSPTVFQFDIYIYRTGTIDFYLNNYQFSYQITNTSAILNGGTLSGKYVTGSSQLPSGLVPAGLAVVNGGYDYIRVDAPMANTSGTLIPTTGLKIGTFQLTNTANYLGQPALICWNAYPALTVVSAMVPSPSSGTQVFITDTVCNILSGIDEHFLSGNEIPFILLSPNPANEVLKFKVQSIKTEGRYMVYDVMGQMLMAGALSGKEFQINISKLPQGLYFLEVENEFGVALGKFVKE